MPVQWLFLYRLLQGLSLSLLLLSAYTGLLQTPIIAWLPQMYIVAGVLLLVLGRLYAHAERNMRLDVLLLNLGLLVPVLIGFSRLLVGIAGFGWTLFLVVVALKSSEWLNSLIYWNLSEKIFNLRQKRKLNILIYLSELPAWSIGALIGLGLFFLNVLPNLILWSALFALLAYMVLYQLLHMPVVRGESVNLLQRTGQVEWLMPERFLLELIKNPYLLRLSIISLFLVACQLLVEFLFLYTLFSGRFSEFNYFVVLATFLVVGNALGVLVGLYFSPSRLGRIGSDKALLLLPLGVLAVSLAMFVVLIIPLSYPFIVAVATLLALLLSMFQTALYDPVSLSLYQTVSPRFRRFGYTFLKVVIYPGAFIIGGFLLYFGTHTQSGLQFLLYASLCLFIMATGWAMLIIRIKKHYLSTLEYAVKLRFIEGNEVYAQDRDTVKILKAKLNADNPEEVIYAVEMLQKMEFDNLRETVKTLLTHHNPKVKNYALSKVEELGYHSLQVAVRNLINAQQENELREKAIRTYLYLNPEGGQQMQQLMQSEETASMKKGVIKGLWQSQHSHNQAMAQKLLHDMLTLSDTADHRMALEIIGNSEIEGFEGFIQADLESEEVSIKEAALLAARGLPHPLYLDTLLSYLRMEHYTAEVSNALESFGAAVLPVLQKELIFTKSAEPSYLLQLCRICGRISGKESEKLLWGLTEHPQAALREAAYQALRTNDFFAKEQQHVYAVHDQLNKLFEQLHWIYTAQAFLENETQFRSLSEALYSEQKERIKQVELLLELLNPNKQTKEAVVPSRGFLAVGADDPDDFFGEPFGRSFELDDEELFSDEDFTNGSQQTLPQHLEKKYMVVSGYYSLKDKVSRLSDYFTNFLIDEVGIIQTILSDVKNKRFSDWTKACALYEMTDITNPRLLHWVSYYLQSDQLLLLEPAIQLLARYQQRNSAEAAERLLGKLNTTRYKLIMGILTTKKQPLMELEKGIILKSTRLFSETPDHLMQDVAGLLKEVRVKKGETVFYKGELGDCMYIIYEGEIKIHDGPHTLNTLINRDFFGDLGLLDAQPRSASATAERDSLLLRLDQVDFYELMANRKEVVRGIMRVLCDRIRQQSAQIADIRVHAL